MTLRYVAAVKPNRDNLSAEISANPSQVSGPLAVPTGLAGTVVPAGPAGTVVPVGYGTSVIPTG